MHHKCNCFHCPTAKLALVHSANMKIIIIIILMGLLQMIAWFNANTITQICICARQTTTYNCYGKKKIDQPYAAKNDGNDLKHTAADICLQSFFYYWKNIVCYRHPLSRLRFLHYSLLIISFLRYWFCKDNEPLCVHLKRRRKKHIKRKSSGELARNPKCIKCINLSPFVEYIFAFQMVSHQRDAISF